MNRRASVLVGLLWCLALLSMVVIGLLHSVSLDLRATKNYGDQIQAHYLALAGVEKAKALLYHESWERRRSRVNHSGKLYDSPQDFRDVAFGRGRFRVFHQDPDSPSSGLIYGVTDEESRLNVNLAPKEELAKLPGLKEEIAAAIADYRDGNNEVTQGGAEEEQYAALKPAYRPRNGPLLTIRELLMVLGLDRDTFLGEDTNANGLLDGTENDGDTSAPMDNHDGRLDAGWSGLVTVDSQSRNVNAAGESRLNVQEADEAELAKLPGFSTEIAQAIVQSRGQNRLESLADLLKVRPPSRNNAPSAPSRQNQGGPPSSQGGGRMSTQGNQPSQVTQVNVSASSPNSGPLLISKELLMDVADDLCTQSDADFPGQVNVNTAPVEVLQCLPGMTRELAHAIVSQRRSGGFFPNIARLLEVPDMTEEIFKNLTPRVCVRSQTFRILSEGKVASTGAARRLEVVVRLGNYYVDTLSWREEDL